MGERWAVGWAWLVVFVLVGGVVVVGSVLDSRSRGAAAAARTVAVVGEWGGWTVVRFQDYRDACYVLTDGERVAGFRCLR